MLVEIFDNVYVSADRVNEVQVCDDPEFGGPCARIWLDNDLPDGTGKILGRSSFFETMEIAEFEARQIVERVNAALQKGSC